MTGERPFTGENTAAISCRITQIDPVPPDAVKGGISPALARLIMKALAKDPDKRHQTPRAMLEDLRSLQSGTLASPGPVAGDTPEVGVIYMPGISTAKGQIEKIRSNAEAAEMIRVDGTWRKRVLWVSLVILTPGVAAAVITLSMLKQTMQKSSPENDSSTGNQTPGQVASLPPAVPARPSDSEKKPPSEPPLRPEAQNSAKDASKTEIQKLLRK